MKVLPRLIVQFSQRYSQSLCSFDKVHQCEDVHELWGFANAHKCHAWRIVWFSKVPHTAEFGRLCSPPTWRWVGNKLWVSSEEKIKMSISMCGNFEYGVVCYSFLYVLIGSWQFCERGSSFNSQNRWQELVSWLLTLQHHQQADGRH